jgi:hypothetical protein
MQLGSLGLSTGDGRIVQIIERRLAASGDVYCDERIDGVDDVAVRTLLLDGNQPIILGVDANVRIGDVWLDVILAMRPLRLAIDLIVGIVDEIDVSGMDGVAAPLMGPVRASKVGFVAQAMVWSGAGP